MKLLPKSFRSDFERILDPIYGACFAFNPNASRMTYRAGMKSGLRILADVQFETMLGKEYSFFPTTQTVGLRIRISGKNIDPAMESYGIPVATGAQTKIGLKLTEIKRMKRPYGICVEKHSKETFYPNHKYTLDVCMRSCSQRRIVETCGCAHPRYGIPMNARICGTEAQDCLLGLRENRSWNPLAECKCNPSCDEIQYYTTISLGRYHVGFTY
ncbi:hypothetical protein L596_008884 [Steinernema carpocapsae]|uniref:Amiloride-sensitive sodium channel n=1 Tax=Steinernema carpocapsae TaxID=34508 RepID=A0A4U5PEL1_STECR|nr:hypothetical protein L596_008884 [Steinernema carpocapsae]